MRWAISDGGRVQWQKIWKQIPERPFRKCHHLAVRPVVAPRSAEVGNPNCFNGRCCGAFEAYEDHRGFTLGHMLFKEAFLDAPRIWWNKFIEMMKDDTWGEYPTWDVTRPVMAISLSSKRAFDETEILAGSRTFENLNGAYFSS